MDRPREKLIRNGPENLSDLELWQVIIGSGTKGAHVAQLASQVLEVIAKHHPKQVKIVDLKQIKGLSEAKSAAIMAVVAWGERRQMHASAGLFHPEQIYPLVVDIVNSKQEHLVVLSLDGAYRMISKRVVAVGGMNISAVHPRDVFAEAVAEHAHAIILVHNHPSGVALPSRADLTTTAQLVKAAQILGVELYDHIIVTTNQWYSMRVKADLTRWQEKNYDSPDLYKED